MAQPLMFMMFMMMMMMMMTTMMTMMIIGCWLQKKNLEYSGGDIMYF
jgi:hypothetical protein